MAKPGPEGLTGRAEVTVKATTGGHGVIGDGMSGRQSGVSGETWWSCCEAARSQSPHSTAAASVAKGPVSKAGSREGGQEGGCATSAQRQESSGNADTAISGCRNPGGRRPPSVVVGGSLCVDGAHGVGAGNGVQGGHCYSLLNKECWTNAFFANAGLVALHTAGNQRDIPDRETTDWRAVCGKTARAVRRAEMRKPSRPLLWGAANCTAPWIATGAARPRDDG